MKKSEREEVLRCVETSLDKLRRASKNNERAATHHLRKKHLYALADLLEPELARDASESGLHQLR